MRQNQRLNPEQFGFRPASAGAHSARTIMVSELEMLLIAVPQEDASFEDYARAVVEENCLQKRSASNRKRTLDNLRILYGLDDKITIFRVLKTLWHKDPASLPLLAFLCASTRDRLLRELTPWLLPIPAGTHVSRSSLEEQISRKYPDRFSPGTLKSTSQNLNASWTGAGFLRGRNKKIRVKAQPSPASVTYALILAFLKGVQGMRLFESEYTAYLDSPKETLFSLAEEASRKGYMRMKRIGEVVDVTFDALLTEAETGGANVQS
ncbi:MAG: hypothetical protein LHW64_03440 [Candidatus Cloacimonetes bacterium]|nr:hypothetical protein [Candidatus Cloacimonadota bacterium]MDY0229161.1 hypothetical protein [Candidatus Cloacimonadaceae bacterium]